MKHRKRTAGEAHSLSRDNRRRDLSGHRKKLTERGPLTSWRRQKKELVSTWRETNQARRTYFLETVEGGSCQDTERTRPSEAHSRSGDGRERDLSGREKKPTEPGALTF